MKRLKLHIGATALSFGVAAAQAPTELPECGMNCLSKVVAEPVFSNSTQEQLCHDEMFYAAMSKCLTQVCTAMETLMVENGVGRDIWTLSDSEMVTSFKLFFFHQLNYFLLLGLAKASILAFYLRIFPDRKFRITVWLTQTFNLSSTFVCLIVMLTLRRPVALNWEDWEGIYPYGRVRSQELLYLTHAMLNITLDVWMVIIPTTQLYYLGLKIRKKIGVIAMFSVGIFLIISSVVRFVYLRSFLSGKQGTEKRALKALIWACIEPCVGVMVGCSPNIRQSTTDGETQSAGSVNTTGQSTVNGLISMSKLISQHKEPVPNVIYQLFGSIIQARSLVSTTFQELMGPDSDEELKRSNESHRHFINTLRSAFKILGGEEWEKTSAATSDDTEDVEQILFANKFQELSVDKEGESSDEDDDVGQPQSPVAARKVSRKPRGKGKKARKYKKPKKGKKQDTKDPATDEIPIESIRIIEDNGEVGLVTDYLLAVYSTVKEWADLRAYTQSLWKEVAYEGLNSAVAGAVSNLTISMVKRTNAAIFVDFPGHDTYETTMNTITRGNMDRAQGKFRLALFALDPDGEQHSQKETALDIKEQFLIHAYQDLRDFVLDFQANRTGKPTKAMQAKISKWDPNFNLEGATNEERVDWRRCYTIKWLYDLVNVFSSIVVQRNTVRGEKHVYENVDWSASGPWGVHRVLFGLNEFAGDITSMAMKKPGTDITKMIYPHHVFQMQCIVDSFTVSRGWSLSALHGHMLEAPAKKGRARRDVDLFLDRQNKRVFAGYCQTVDLLKQILEKDGKMAQHKDFFEIIKIAQLDFVDFLGEHKYTTGLDTIPPSRFVDHNPNGLQEYSPFLCGVGLEEGLEIAYRLGMFLWERMPEPTLMIHLHNAVVQKGYLSRPVGLCATLEDLFKHTFFAQGRKPRSGFVDALLASVGQPGSRQAQAQRQAIRYRRRFAENVHQLFDLEINQIFKRNSMLTTCRRAGWNLEAIPDEELQFGSMMFFERLSRAKHVSEKELEDTVLVQKARAVGMTDKEIIEATNKLSSIANNTLEVPNEVLDRYAPEGFQFPPSAGSEALDGRDILELAKFDILSDVAGIAPISSLNYLGVTCWLLITFGRIEERLKEAGNPVYFEAYEGSGPWKSEKRVALALLALKGDNEECLRIVADTLNEARTGFMDFIYWKDLETEPREREADVDPSLGNECTVM
ncbi:hypothetical protein BFJ63_vAg14848 [Fusarium oxysporum f. sp. narcissi]|uniref:Rhodopsin domain-containing protein n=1 Tax=Fusarium oxysporum f. sp. narcissi TaxID=451672 RepID=A0A4V1RYN8_FUSOX|nr:hypothetical protein BFJ63_vAg14848 [Fusarium oxysporum f. sp. narcissi]